MLRRTFAFVFVIPLLLALGSCIFSLFSCSPNASIQGTGESFLQGEWEQVTNAADQKLVNYTLYHIKFTCDSFYVKMNTYSKVNYGADTCMNKGYWTEYAKGLYNMRNDTLHLKGFFTNADNSLKNVGGCFRAGVYEEYFKTRNDADTLLQLTNTSGVLPLNLHLNKRITCVPKPL
jgi:hypothetical protein